MKTNGDVLTSRELAQRWGLNPNTPANWRKQGKGPKYFKLTPQHRNSKVRYRLTDVLDHERRNTIKPKEKK